MESLFIKLVNLSITAGWLILAVLLLRLFLRRAPRWIFCLLWGIVGLRLVLPFSPESMFSLVPSAETIPETIMLDSAPAIDSGIGAIDRPMNHIISGSFTPDPAASANPLQIVTAGMSAVWIAGVIAMLLYLGGSCLRLRRRVRTATLLRDNIRRSEFVASPFILGIFRPRIYIPYHLDETRLSHVLAHENAHIARGDHLIKPFAFLILSVYWFHPLVWIAYVLLCRDIELACDERVIRGMDAEQRKSYSLALLGCSAGRHMPAACPLAFGEVGIKERVVHVKTYKKPAFRLVLISIVVCAVAAICFLTKPKEEEPALLHDNTATALWQEIETAGKTDALLTGIHEQVQSTYTEEENKEDIKPITSLDEAVSHAILEQNKSSQTKYADYVCCDFMTLETVPDTGAEKNDTRSVKVYGWSLYQEYIVSDAAIETWNESYIPVALTFDIDEGIYTLREYWQPESDGNEYVTSIRERFPASIVRDVIDSLKYRLTQTQRCYAQAVEYSRIDTDVIIEALISDICSGPGEILLLSSNPEDYIANHYRAYRELLYYGDYTVKYCFKRFESGTESGLEGHVMARACEEILEMKDKIPADAETTSTGQDWYITLKAHASNIIELYSD